MEHTKRYWIATASHEKCRHADALHEIGFINWHMGKTFHFQIGDVVYLFMKDERRVRFQLEVVDENCSREDQAYWIEAAPKDVTYKLKFLNEHAGCLLDELTLCKYGFNGGTQNPTYKNTDLTDYITSVFDNEYNIIDMVIPKSQQRTRDNVRLIMPVLIHWAKTGHDNRVYGDLIHAIGKTNFSGIGHALYFVQKVLDFLSDQNNTDIPTLNSLCKNKTTMLPSEGFEFVSPKYNELDDKGKRAFVKELDSAAINYPNWDWVLNELGLKESIPFVEKDLENIRHPHYFGGGEGKEHKELKEYVLKHPEAIGIKDVVYSETEYVLPSGDKLDVFFRLSDGTHVAVEIKPSISPNDDIQRGIFQCIKYYAVMDALRIIECAEYKIKTLLVTARTFTIQHNVLANELDIKFIDNFRP